MDDGVRSPAWLPKLTMSGCAMDEAGGQLRVSVAPGTPDGQLCGWGSASSYDMVQWQVSANLAP